MLKHRLLGLAVAVSFVLGISPNAEAQVYVAYYDAGIINKYDVDTGALITERFISGLNKPRSLCLANGTSTSFSQAQAPLAPTVRTTAPSLTRNSFRA